MSIDASYAETLYKNHPWRVSLSSLVSLFLASCSLCSTVMPWTFSQSRKADVYSVTLSPGLYWYDEWKCKLSLQSIYCEACFWSKALLGKMCNSIQDVSVWLSQIESIRISIWIWAHESLPLLIKRLQSLITLEVRFDLSHKWTTTCIPYSCVSESDFTCTCWNPNKCKSCIMTSILILFQCHIHLRFSMTVSCTMTVNYVNCRVSGWNENVRSLHVVNLSVSISTYL